MRSWIFGAITVVCVTLGSTAGACPTSGGEAGSVVPSPRPVQNVSFQASELVERASRLESAAISREQSARSLDESARTLEGRAFALRRQASLVSSSQADRVDRRSILEVADELGSRALADRQQAASARAQADQLRFEARSLRDRAVQLVRVSNPRESNPGGWRRSDVVPKATTSITL